MIISLFLVASISLFKTWPNYLRLFSLNLYSIVHSYHSVNNFTFSSIFPKCRVTLHICRETLHKWRRKNETTGGKGCRGLDLVFAATALLSKPTPKSPELNIFARVEAKDVGSDFFSAGKWRGIGGAGIEGGEVGEAWRRQPPSPKRETLLLRRKEGFRERGHLNCMLHIS